MRGKRCPGSLQNPILNKRYYDSVTHNTLDMKCIFFSTEKLMEKGQQTRRIEIVKKSLQSLIQLETSRRT
jgi:hypothetical protein